MFENMMKGAAKLEISSSAKGSVEKPRTSHKEGVRSELSVRIGEYINQNQTTLQETADILSGYSGEAITEAMIRGWRVGSQPRGAEKVERIKQALDRMLSETREVSVPYNEVRATIDKEMDSGRTLYEVSVLGGIHPHLLLAWYKNPHAVIRAGIWNEFNERLAASTNS